MTDKEILDAMRSMIEPINKRLDGMDKRFDEVEESLQVVRNSQITLELEHLPKIKAALDGVVGAVERDKAQGERITFLEKKADNHDIRIYAVEQALKAK